MRNSREFLKTTNKTEDFFDDPQLAMQKAEILRSLREKEIQS